MLLIQIQKQTKMKQIMKSAHTVKARETVIITAFIYLPFSPHELLGWLWHCSAKFLCPCLHSLKSNTVYLSQAVSFDTNDNETGREHLFSKTLITLSGLESLNIPMLMRMSALPLSLSLPSPLLPPPPPPLSLSYTQTITESNKETHIRFW